MDYRDYNIGGTSYSSRMTDLNQQYKNAVRDAELANRDNGGRPTNEEANCYRRAIDICTKIINLNVSQQAVMSKWTMMKRCCEEELDRIIRALEAEKQKQAQEQKPEPKLEAPEDPKTHVTAAGFRSPNATKNVPAEVIETWYEKKFYFQERNRVDQLPEQEMLTFDKVPGLAQTKEFLKRTVLDLDRRGWSKISVVNGMYQIPRLLFYAMPDYDRSLILALINELRMRQYTYLHVSEGTFRNKSDEDAAELLRTVFAEAASQSAYCVLHMEDLETYCASVYGKAPWKGNQRVVTEFQIGMRNLMEKNREVVVIAESEWPIGLDQRVLQGFTQIRRPLSYPEGRRAYLMRYLADCQLNADLSFEEMARRTRSFNREELMMLVINMRTAMGLTPLSSTPNELRGAVLCRENFERALSNRKHDPTIAHRKLYAFSQFLAFEFYRKQLFRHNHAARVESVKE